MNIYENMAYKAPSSLTYMRMRSSELQTASEKGDEEATAELARRRANRDDEETQLRRQARRRYGSDVAKQVAGFHASEQAYPAGGYSKAESEAHFSMTTAQLNEAAAKGDAAATAELQRRARNREQRAHRRSGDR